MAMTQASIASLRSGLTEQHARGPTESVVDRSDLNPGEQLGERCLSAGASSPDLGDHAAMAARRASRQPDPP